METQENQSLKQKKIALAQSEHAPVVIELLKDCRTELMSVIADDEFHTLVNALTLEKEAELIRRVVVYIDEIKQGSLHEQQGK